MIEFTRGETLLKVDHVNLSFGNTVVLRDLNAEIKHLVREDGTTSGQVVCFLGPSGIGKTQSSKVIAALQPPTSGAILLHGEKAVRRGDVCMVPQNYPMFEFATVARNLQIAGEMGGLSRDQINQKATSLIETFGLRAYLSAFPKELSGGTRQRVAIARQLMCVGHYIVMDEPFSGLDPINKKLAMQAIMKLASLDTYNVIIVVTHDISSGMAISDTVWMMGLEKGVAGARIVKEYDLATMGLAWRPDIEDAPEFKSLVTEVSGLFKTLKP
jgi:ABC-type nitrate/sulfonate/bicarbonate transport system ATPase subunit